jgi:hypothetical protein
MSRKLPFSPEELEKLNSDEIKRINALVCKNCGLGKYCRYESKDVKTSWLKCNICGVCKKEKE